MTPQLSLTHEIIVTKKRYVDITVRLYRQEKNMTPQLSLTHEIYCHKEEIC